jgi:GT2 family glycosyltransferase
MPTIAILIPHSGGEELLRRCLNSVVRQSRSPDDIVVFDNGSTDGSIDSARLFEGVRTVSSPHNIGFASAINRMVATTACDFIFLLNNDAVLNPDSVSEVICGTERHPEIQSFAITVMDFERPSEYHSIGLMFSKHAFGNRSNRLVTPAPMTDCEVFCPCGAAAVYHRTSFERLGGFNERFFFGYEDLEFGIRCRLHGIPTILLANALALHQGGATIARNHSLKVQEIVKNSMWTLCARLPMKFLFRNAIHIVPFYFRWFSRLVASGYIVDVVHGIARFFASVPSIIASRFQRTLGSERRIERLFPLYEGPIEVYTPLGHIRMN